MKKIILFAFLVLVVFFTYSTFGAGFGLKAHADNDRGKEFTEIRGNVSVETRVGSDNDEDDEDIEDADDNELEIEIEIENEDEDVESTSSLKRSIEDREDKLKAEASSTKNRDKQDALEDHDGMRLAVHALLSSRNLLGGIGQEVSVLAKDLNSSVTSTLSAEVKMQSRGWMKKILFGGDKENSASILGRVNQNKKIIQKLNALIAGCATCSADLKVMLQARLKLAEDEQVRLEAIAKNEIEARGFFGVLFGWLKD